MHSLEKVIIETAVKI